MDIKNHNDLLDNLAIAKGGVIYKNINCGSPWESTSVPVADLLIIRPSYSRFCIDIYEVKYSRADFLSDINTGKWEKYLPFCHRFYFAVLRGICDLKEIPESAGLLTFKKELGWRCHRGAMLRHIKPSLMFLQSLLFYRQKRNSRRKSIANDFEIQWYREQDRINAILKERGAEISEFLAWRENKK